MSTVDERLEQLFAGAAVEPSTQVDILAAVARKRHQRHARRVARNVGVAVVLLFVLAGSLAWLTAGNARQPAVAPSTARGDVAARVGADWRVGRVVALEPDVGYVRGPLIASGEYVALATYDRDGTGFKVPPSRVVRIDATGRVLDTIDLQGEILSLADGQGARWVVTHDADNVAPRQYRLKRIGADGSLLSNTFPPGVEPNRPPIVAGGGAVWVPVDGGVLRFDPTTGAHVETVPLPGWRAPRLVQFGPDVYVYNTAARPGDGSALGQLAHLNPTLGAPPTIVRIEEAAVDVVATPTGVWALTWSDGRSVLVPVDLATGSIDRSRALRLPREFVAGELQATGNTLWVRGGSRLLPVTVKHNGRAVAGTPVVIHPSTRGELLALSGGELLVAADGRLYRVSIGG